MPLFRWLLVVGALLLAGVASAERYDVGPAPAWVKPVVLPRAPAGEPGSAGHARALLIETQSNWTTNPPQTYSRNAIQALNELGVPEVSQLTVRFNPAYETLRLHEATIHRGTTKIPVPLRGRVRILEREERLEAQIHDGVLTAIVVVEDVRPGDIVEWSYTRTGTNPVLGGQYATEWVTRALGPVSVLHYRLLWPAARPLRMLRGDATVHPTVTRRGDVDEYQMFVRDVPRVTLDDGVPGWYDALGSVALTSSRSWAEVATWGRDLFAVPAELTPALRARVAEFEKEGTVPEERAMRAVRFVQDEIRYLGIEIGENTHRATAPDIVLARRYGDCKDKALLLVTFLRALGFEAYPALVNTIRRDSVATSGVSGILFDHAIVQAKTEGYTWWIDATANGQRGDMFARLSPPPFGAALVLAESTTGLTRIENEGTVSMNSFEKEIDARSYDEPATMTVTSNWYGDGAALVRVGLRASGLEQLAEGYLEFYRRAYPKIVADGPVVVEDDEDQNHVRTIERYRIPDFWQKEDETGAPWADATAYELLSELPYADAATRTMPLALREPKRLLYTATVRTPPDVVWPSVDEKIEIPGFALTTRSESRDGRISIFHDLVRTRNHLTAAEANAAAEKIEAMQIALASEVGRSAPGAAGSWLGMLPGAMALMTMALVALLFVHLHQLPAPATIWPNTEYREGSEPWPPGQPLGGWLYLFGFGMVASPFVGLYNLVLTVNQATLGLANGFEGELAHADVLILVETILTAAVFAWQIGMLTFFLQRRRIFFRIYVAAVVLFLVQITYELVLLQMVTPGSPDSGRFIFDLVRNLASAMIWSTYFVRSRRVEATFVR